MLLLIVWMIIVKILQLILLFIVLEKVEKIYFGNNNSILKNSVGEEKFIIPLLNIIVWVLIN